MIDLQLSETDSTIERRVYLKLRLDWFEVYKAFWALNSDGMAMFFNELSLQPNLPMQLQYVTDSEKLNRGGRDAMATIGTYAEKT
jgi:hypothetical protein